MGNNETKDKESSFNSDDVKNRAVFNVLSKNAGQLLKNDALVAWSKIIDQQLVEIVLNVLFSNGTSVKFKTYNEFATTLIKGNHCEKADVILQFIDGPENCQDRLRHFLSSIVSSVIKVEQKKANEEFMSWSISSANADFNRFVHYCMCLAGGEKESYSNQDICVILPVIDSFISLVFSQIFGSDKPAHSFFPRWQRLRGDDGKKLTECSILNFEDILFLNIELPVDNKLVWRLLFSTKIHGESFSRLAGQIMNEGPTLIIVRDKDNYVFGAFAPANWMLNPNFTGDSSSFVFSLHPNMHICQASNYNENFQYLNQGQQTLPNGLGVGGRLDYFGIWLDSEFGKGKCNDSCTTFRNFKRLSKEKEFQCADVEVWGVGEPPPSSEELGERSVLDGNTEAKALLQLAGRKTYSDGLREEPKD